MCRAGTSPFSSAPQSRHQGMTWLLDRCKTCGHEGASGTQTILGLLPSSSHRSCCAPWLCPCALRDRPGFPLAVHLGDLSCLPGEWIDLLGGCQIEVKPNPELCLIFPFGAHLWVLGVLAALAPCRLPGYPQPSVTRSPECSEPSVASTSPLERSRPLGWELPHVICGL